MIITDHGQQFKVCDECGERFYPETGASTIPTSTAMILTGYYHFEHQLGDVCTRCAENMKVDVCHGSCLKWHYKSALNEEGLCMQCEGEQIAKSYDSIYITGQSVAFLLEKTRRDYQRVRFLISEAIILGITLEYMTELEGIQ